MKDLAMLLYFLILLPLLPFFYLSTQLRRQYWLNRKGYWVGRQGRDNIRYEERRDGSIRQLTISGEMMAVGPHVIYIPSEEKWRSDVPEWATTRREEILSRVQDVLGRKNYEYDFS